MNKKWKKLNTKQILNHPRLNVFEDEVQLPSGHITDYIHFGDASEIASVIAVREDGKILVLREYCYPPDTWLYHIPGGHLEGDEPPEDGAARELAEEGDLKAKKLENIGGFYIDNRRHSSKLHVFVATDLSPTTARKDAEEEFEAFWFTPAEIDAMIRDGIITVSNFLSAWSIYKAVKA